MYHMNKKQETNAFVKECITTALLQMMETQSIEDIAIVDLIRKAGVSRNSFYRNFASRRDVIAKHLVLLIREWGEEYEEYKDPKRFSESLLRHYYKYKDFYLLLYRQGMSDMIYETIRLGCELDEAKNNMERYMKSMVAGMIWVDEWMRQGMPETPDEIILLTAQADQKNGASAQP